MLLCGWSKFSPQWKANPLDFDLHTKCQFTKVLQKYNHRLRNKQDKSGRKEMSRIIINICSHSGLHKIICNFHYKSSEANASSLKPGYLCSKS